MRRLYLCDSTSGDVVDDVFVITNKQFSATATGKYFIKAFLSDRTAQLTARMWNATRDLFNALPESGFVRIRGRIENYQNNLQFIIEQAGAPKDGSFDIAELIPHTNKDIPQMCCRLQELLGSVQNRHLAALIQAYLDDAKLMEQFCKAPAAMSFHHAYIGGLLEHTLNSIEVAEAVCKFYPTLNRDLVITGVFLHDIAKTWELCYDCSFGYTDGGQLVGHIVKSAIWVEQKSAIAEQMIGEPIPRPLIEVLQHIILSHHGNLENGFGSARNPSTPEALAVHLIDDLDAKLMVALSATRGDGVAGAEGNWTEYIKSLGGRLYRPDPAPAEVTVVEEEPPTLQPMPQRAVPQPGPEQPAAAPSPASQPAKPVVSQQSQKTAPAKPTLNNPMFEIKK
jgi:3'-5' exoribonuclease